MELLTKLKRKPKDKESKDSKDSKEPILKFSTSVSKENLVADNEDKSDELESLLGRNKNLQSLVNHLEDKFIRSKWRPTRYRRLKRMIKQCTSEDAFTEKNQSENNLNEDVQGKGVSEKFKETAAILEQKHKELQKKKEDLKELNEDLSRQIQKEKDKKEYFTNRIIKLRKDYDLCKRYKFLQKYFVMKEIIKTFLNDTKSNTDIPLHVQSSDMQALK